MANLNVLQEITQSLKPVYDNPDVLICISTEDLIHEANQRGITLTIDQAREIGKRAFKHCDTSDLIELIGLELNDYKEGI